MPFTSIELGISDGTGTCVSDGDRKYRVITNKSQRPIPSPSSISLSSLPRLTLRHMFGRQSLRCSKFSPRLKWLQTPREDNSQRERYLRTLFSLIIFLEIASPPKNTDVHLLPHPFCNCQTRTINIVLKCSVYPANPWWWNPRNNTCVIIPWPQSLCLSLPSLYTLSDAREGHAPLRPLRFMVSSEVQVKPFVASLNTAWSILDICSRCSDHNPASFVSPAEKCKPSHKPHDIC